MKGRIARLVIVALLVVGWMFTLRPATLGGPLSVVVVSGNSMLPDLTPGELVLAYRRESYDVGDVVVYQIPKGELGAGTRVIHRVVGGSAREGFLTRGDNRRTNDSWRPRPSEIEGLKFAAVPGAGKVMMRLSSPTSIAALAALMVFVSVDGVRVPRRRRRGSATVVVRGGGPVVAMWPPVAPVAVAPVVPPVVAVATLPTSPLLPVVAVRPVAAVAPPVAATPEPVLAAVCGALDLAEARARLPLPASAPAPAPAPARDEAHGPAPLPLPPVGPRRRRASGGLVGAARGLLRGARASRAARPPVTVRTTPPQQPTPVAPASAPVAPAPARPPAPSPVPFPRPALALMPGPAPALALMPGPAPRPALMPGPAPALALMPGPAPARAAACPVGVRRRRRGPRPLRLIAVAGGVVGGVLASRAAHAR